MGIFNTISSAVSSTVDKVTSKISSAASTAASNCNSIFDNVSSSISDTGSSAEDAIEFLTDDGEDDGKISIGSAIANIAKGVGNTIVNGVKGMFTDSEGNFSIGKTLLTVGTVAACIACPAVGVALGAVGVAAGSIQIGKGIYGAITADTDAEAESAFQNIGGGTFTVALSALGTKASMKVMKSASTAGVNGGSAIDEATSVSGKISGFFKDAVSSTKNNVTSITSKLSSIKNASKNADDTASMSVEEAKQAFDDYQYQSDMANSTLRRGSSFKKLAEKFSDDENLSSWFKRMDDFVNNGGYDTLSTSVDSDTVVYRTVFSNENYSTSWDIGEIITEKGFTSTTSDSSFASYWANEMIRTGQGSADTLTNIQILIQKGTKVIQTNSGMCETLIKNGSQFKVIAYDALTNTYTWLLENIL